MTFEKISEQAYKRQNLSTVCNLAEKYAYIQLLNLYRDYSNEMITKDEAKKLKIKIEKEYNLNQEKIDQYYEYLKEQNEIRGKYTDLLADIQKNSNSSDCNLNKILEDCLKYIELIIQDNSFSKKILEKIN